MEERGGAHLRGLFNPFRGAGTIGFLWVTHSGEIWHNGGAILGNGGPKAHFYTWERHWSPKGVDWGSQKPFGDK